MSCIRCLTFDMSAEQEKVKASNFSHQKCSHSLFYSLTILHVPAENEQ